MASYTPEVIRILRDHGCALVRKGKGDHEIWHSPITDRNFPVMAISNRGTGRTSC